MRIDKISQTGVGQTGTYPVNWRGGPGGFALGLGAVISGTVTYTVQYCFDDVLKGDTPTWFDHAILATQTTNKDGSILFPISAIRLNVTAGTGTVTLTMVPASGGL